MPTRVRTATDADAAQIAPLLGELGYPAPAADVPQRLARVRAERGECLVAEDEAGALVALMTLARHDILHSASPAAQITGLVVTAAARGSGTGRMLVEAAKAWARAAGCGRIAVTSAEHRADAHAFYPACGMPYTGRRFSLSL